MIQAILVFLLLLLLVQLVAQPLTSLWQRIFAFGLVGFGVLFVLRPNLTNVIAHSLGVGRGADLLNYFAVCAGSIILYRLYLRLRVLELREVEIVRELAIMRYSESGVPNHVEPAPPSCQQNLSPSPSQRSRRRRKP